MPKTARNGFTAPVLFTMAGAHTVFAGWTDGSRWNGWLNVEVMPGTRDAIVEELVETARRHAGRILSRDEVDEATGGIGAIPVDPNGRVSLTNGFTTLEAEGRDGR